LYETEGNIAVLANYARDLMVVEDEKKLTSLFKAFLE
jgi:hypothetical protein